MSEWLPADHLVWFVLEVVDQLIGESSIWKAAMAWRKVLAGRPRIAEHAFEWHRDAPAA